MTTRKQKMLASACGAAALIAGQAGAQTEEASVLEEVVVTAQKREERLLDVPVSVTAISAESLHDMRV